MKKTERKTITVEYDSTSCAGLSDVVEIDGKLYIPLYTTPDSKYTSYSVEYSSAYEPFSVDSYGEYVIYAHRLEDDEKYETRINVEKQERLAKREAKRKSEEQIKAKELAELERLKKKYES